MQKPKVCRHCKKEVVSRPRGLGWRCYYTPGVKDLYPAQDQPQTPTASASPLPPEHTDAPAGSLRKMRVMHARARAGYALHHPRDSRTVAAENPFACGKWRGVGPTGLEEIA